MTQENEDKLDTATVRRFANLLKNKQTKTDSSIVTGKVIQNNNSLMVAVDDETLIPISNSSTNVNVGDEVAVSITENTPVIIGNMSDVNTTSSELDKTDKTANQAVQDADDARKVATNYIDIDENKGITVGNLAEGALGKNSYIDANGFYVRDGETVLSGFESDRTFLDKGNLEISTDSGYVNLAGQKDAIVIMQDMSGVSGSGKLLLQENLTELIARYGGSYALVQTKADNHNNGDTEETGDFIDAQIALTTTQLSSKAKIFLESHVVKTGTGAYHKVTYPSYIYVEADNFLFNNKNVSVEGHTHAKADITDFAHDHAGDELTPATIDATSTIKQGGVQVSLEGHTHVMDDITDFTQKMFMTKGFKVSYTLPANTLKDVTISNKVDGYTPIGVFDYSTNNGGVYPARISVGTAGTATFGLKNTTSSQISTTLGVNFLYVKSDFFDKYN